MAKKEVTKKQRTIVLLIYTFRFINSKQIQEFLNHKDHKRVNAWLKDLVTKEYIARDFKVVYGTLTKPAVYSLTGNGRKYMRDHFTYSFPKYLKRISRDNKASMATKIRSQVIADWYLMLFSPLLEKNEAEKNEQEKVEKDKTGIGILDYVIKELTTDTEEEEKIPLNKQHFFTPAYFPPFILLGKIKPDGYLRLRKRGGIMHGLLFVIDAYIPRFLLRYTLKRIFDTLDEEYWEDDNMHSLNIYFLCPNNQIIIYIRRLLKQSMQAYYADTPLNFHFATRNQLHRKKSGKTTTVGWKIVSSDDDEDDD